MNDTISEAGPLNQGHLSDRRYNWETRVMLASPLSLWLSVLVIVTAIFASFLACYAWNGLDLIVYEAGEPALSTDTWTALCMSLLWGSIFGLNEFTRRANLVDLIGLKSNGFVVDEAHLDGMAFGQTKRSRQRATRFGLIGLGMGYVFYNLVYQPNEHVIRFLHGTLTNYWFIFMTMTLFAESFRSLSYIRNDTRSLLNKLDARIEIDFFDIGKLDGLGRIALRRALPWVVTAAIVLLLIFSQRSATFFWVLFSALLANATFVFAAPMWRIHILIDKAKNAELLKLRRDIAASRLLFESASTTEVSARLSALLALEHHLERVREWPLDLSTIVRFGLYLALPLGSWLGGTLVERAVNFWAG
ncbi:MAG: hypothetical protein ACOH12_10980 [Parvibaculaceae bacterium]